MSLKEKCKVCGEEKYLGWNTDICFECQTEQKRAKEKANEEIRVLNSSIKSLIRKQSIEIHDIMEKWHEDVRNEGKDYDYNKHRIRFDDVKGYERGSIKLEGYFFNLAGKDNGIDGMVFIFYFSDYWETVQYTGRYKGLFKYINGMPKDRKKVLLENLKKDGGLV